MTEAAWWVDGPKVRALREARELSIAQLARQAQISNATLSKMERSDGPGRMTWPPNVNAIAAVLGVPAEELIAGDLLAFRTALARVPQKQPPG